MSSFGGGLNVAACVTSVISAFQEADTLIQRLKVRRVSRRLPLPPNLLEDTILQAPEEIARATRRGVERLGRRFEEGDYAAVISIQQITIHLQNGLLQRLRGALDRDEGVEFGVLIDLADGARDGTVSELIVLRQRLLQYGGGGVQVPGHFESVVPRIPAGMPAQVEPSQVSMVQRYPPQMPPQMPSQMPNQIPAQAAPPEFSMAPRRASHAPSTSTAESFAEPRRHTRVWVDPWIANSSNAGDSNTNNSQQSVNHRSGADPNQQPTTHRSGSVFGLLKRNGTRANSEDTVRRVDAPPQALVQSPVSPSFYGRSYSHSGQPGALGRVHENAPMPSHDVSNNHFEIWAPDPTGYTPYGMDAQSTFSEKSRTNSIISTRASTAPTISTYPTNISTTPRTLLATPNPQNDYLGFCKGAWKAQNDDPKAMIERRDFAQTAQSSMTFPSCSKCGFKGHVESRLIWNKVITDPARGLKYRWSFLAKSHVSRKLAGGRDRNYAYQCLFCVFMGLREQVIYTESTYLEHVSRVHRVEVLDGVILHRTRCINDRVCGNGERFDVNLFPVSGVGGGSEGGRGEEVERVVYDLSAFELAAN